MKIALVHYASHPVIGGVERILHAHARIFRDHGHDVAVLSQRGDADFPLPSGGTKETYLREVGPMLAGSDVVIVHNVMTMPFDLPLTEALTELAQTHPSTRWIAWVHDVAAVNPDLRPAAEVLCQAAAGFEYVAVSALRARQFKNLTGVTARVIPNGIDPTEVLGIPLEVAAFAQRHMLLDGRPVLLHPTRLLRRKNVELGFAVVDAMRASGAVLLITGAEDSHNAASPEYAASLRSERERLGLGDRVIFVADELEPSDRTVAALYQVADALFFPSRQEGFGLPVLEAALHRMPCFVADIEPLTELAGPNTRLFRLEDPPSKIADAILENLENDPGTKARKRALAYRWDRIYQMHLEPLLSDSGRTRSSA